MGRADRGALLLGALAGASVWISYGALAITTEDSARIGTLPSLWLLPILALTVAASGWLIALKTSESWPLALTAILWLPWLPTAVPAALLLWEGPLETLIWGAALAGVMAARLTRFRGSKVSRFRGSEVPKFRSSTAYIAGAIVFVCSIAAWSALRDRVPDGDEPHYLIIAQSLLRDGDLQIANNHRRGDYLEYHADPLPPDFLRRGINDQIYSIHAPGLAALLLPIYAIAGYAGSAAFIAFLCAVGVALIWRSVFDLLSDSGAAWAASMAVALSAPYFFHSFTIFPDPVGAVVVAMTLALLIKLETAPATIRRWQMTSVSIALAVLPWLHSRFALIAGAAAGCIALRLVRLQRARSLLGTFVAVPVISAVAWFSFFWVLYGTPDPAAPYGGSRQSAMAWMINGAIGLLFDQQFGLLPNAPVILLAAFGFAMLLRRHRRLAIELIAIAIPYSALVTSFGMWWGGWSAPARLLVAVIPVAAPALGVAWVSGPAIRMVFIALTLLGLANGVGRLVMFDGALLYNERNGYDLLLDWLTRTVNLPLAMPAVHRTGPMAALATGVVWVVAAIVTVITLSIVFRDRRAGPSARWALTIATAIGAMSLAITVSWKIAQAEPLTLDASQVSLTARWHPRLQPMSLEIPSLRYRPASTAIQRLRFGSSSRLPRSGGDYSLLEISRLPAGVYRFVVEGASPVAGDLMTSVASNGATLDRFTIDGLPVGETTLMIDLPVNVLSFVVRGDRVAASRISSLRLAPVDDSDGARRFGEFAVSAIRYGRTRVFALNEKTFLEPGGLWTRGNSSAKVFVAANQDWTEVAFQSGPVATMVEVAGDAWKNRLELGPRERRQLLIPTARPLTIRTTGGFRPVDHEPATQDLRLLGVRLEFAPPNQNEP